MASRIERILIDDLDGQEGQEGEISTVTFGWNGDTFEIDLSAHNRELMEKTFTPYLEKARLVRNANGRRPATKRTQVPTAPPAKEVRAWAKAQKITVPERGRIPNEVYDQYRAAHAG